ncbi:17423_t:CDS:2 [Dentiscutata heterogama]|uniref:17423_t:CDS:1 n=1 Tax=Dentiscutata heterogama TaxID=1316150 RepID=A0ACA9L901_9GLOM|nr:17423_t:CDS:2 [Dentiscutata heterogama]
MNMPKKINVNVIGAGVIGLTTALILQRNRYLVEILSEHWPGDLNINYSSPWAVAAWRASLYIEDERVHEYEKISWNEFWTLSENPETGLMHVQIYDFMDKKPEFGSDIWFKDFVPEFRVISLEELPSGVEYGVFYVTSSQLIYIQISAFMQITHFECLLIIVSLNVQKYLQWLLDQFIASGRKRKKVHLSHINESFFNDNEIDVVVNCTEVNARTFSGLIDNTVLPLRGQTISVWAPHIKTVHILTNQNSFIFVVPRRGGEVILGGTIEMNDYSENPDPETAEDIIQRCVKLCPELTPEDKSLQIIRHNVGRRPYRKNGIRVEVEITKNTTNKDVIIWHNYGHHSYGNVFKNTKKYAYNIY